MREGAEDQRAVVDELCRRHGLGLLELQSHSTDHSRSRFVARVRDQAGKHLLLKQVAPKTATGQIASLRAWQPTGLVPRLVAQLAPDIYLAEWLVGPTLAELPHQVDADAEGIGRMLRGLHAVTSPDGLSTLREVFVPEDVEQWMHLPREMIELGVQTAKTLRRVHPLGGAMLHGDLVPSSVILTNECPKVIDPIGLQGLPAWDVAKLAVAAEGRGRPRLLCGLLSGYGSMPPHLADVFAWLTLAYLQRHLAAGRKDSPLGRLAHGIVRTGGPREFLRTYV